VEIVGVSDPDAAGGIAQVAAAGGDVLRRAGRRTSRGRACRHGLGLSPDRERVRHGSAEVSDASAMGLLLVMIGIDPAHEDELNRWYDEEHFPERIACPGFLNGRRYTTVQGAPKYLAIYDLETPAVLETDAYRRIAGRSPWTERLAEKFDPIVRNVYVEIRPPVTNGTRHTGDGLLLVAIDVDPRHEAELNRWYDDEHIAERMAIAGFLRARRFVALEGRPRYLALYDLESSAVLDSAAYRHAAGPAATPMTRRMQGLFNPMIRNVYAEIAG
jgi:hypothetical protein